MVMLPSTETLPQRHLAFISLALGFLVIWTAVLAGVLVSRTLKEQAAAEEAVKVFHTHQDLGRISFSLGHELVSTVDWLVSDWPDPKEAKSLTWNETDTVLSSVRAKSPGRWDADEASSAGSLLDALEAKLVQARRGCQKKKGEGGDPGRAVLLYSQLNDLLLKKAYSLPPESFPYYALYVQGMFQRFGELALGTAYAKTGIPPLDKTLFLELRMGSEKLMEAAFRLASPRSHARWLELQEPRVAQALRAVADQVLLQQSSSSSGGEGSSGHPLLRTKASYLERVEEQIAILLLTKEVLNTAAASRAERLYGRCRSTLAFHLSVAGVAVGAVLVCLLVTGCTFAGLGGRSSSDYSLRRQQHRSDDKQHMLADSFPKPHCYF